jgi:response regulator RpfG family c-di-GMP phosphodiesterase
MLNDLKSLEPQLKEILYQCLEDVQATKAALYLSATPDLNDKKYELITSYQYVVTDRRQLNATDDLVDRLIVRRDSFFVNGLAADPRFAEMLFRQDTDRLLATPLFSRGRLVGFIDMRDKAGKKPFEAGDVDAARKIANDVLALLGSKSLFGVGPIALVEELASAPPLAVIPSPAARMPLNLPSPAAPAVQAPSPNQPRAGQALSPAALQVVESARQHISRRQLAQFIGKAVLSEGDLEIVKTILPAALAIPGAVLASFSAIGHQNNPQLIVSLGTITDDFAAALQVHLEGFVKRLGLPWMILRAQLTTPFGVRPDPIAAANVVSVLSAPVNPHSLDGLVLTVAFEQTPDAAAHRALQLYLREIEAAVESAVTSNLGRSDRQAIAEKLLEPDFQKFPELAEHTRQVAAIAQRFARLLELPAPQVESIRLAALVHDVGLRLLDYDRLYRKQGLTAEEMKAISEHPVIGAALVEPLLGSEIAAAVLRHHERVDGKGYPSKLTGAQIPLASKIIQICDAWVAMVAQQSYQSPVSREDAVAAIRSAAGTQFDEALALKFVESIQLVAG